MVATVSFYVVSWDGNTLNDATYDTDIVPSTPWGLPPVSIQTTPRMDAGPVVSGIDQERYEIGLRISVKSTVHATVQAAREELAGWFDPRDKTAKPLVIRDGDGTQGGDAGTRARSVNAICSGLAPISDTANGFFVTLVVDNDVFWRATTATTHNWSVTASGDTVVVNNPGKVEVYPKITITPTTAKSSASFEDRQFVTIRWRVDEAAQSYPVDIVNNGFDTQTIITATDMQADGDDLRVEVGGVEVDRWLQDINTSTTQVWVNLDFKAKWESTIAAAIGIGDTVTSITVTTSTLKAPAFGILIINSEAFYYSAKDDGTKTFTIQTRASFGTSAANHSLGDTIWWCQHSIYMKWNDSSASAPTVDDDFKPAFLLNSTNTSWDYDDFGADEGKRTGSWKKASLFRSPDFYTANRGTEASPWEEMGIELDSHETGGWWLYNPCGITVADFQNGEEYVDAQSHWSAQIKSSKDGVKWYLEDTIAAPGADQTWNSWSDTETLTAGRKGVRLQLHARADVARLEVADVTLTLNSSNTPVVALVGGGGGEVAGYDLSCVLANNTISKEIDVNFLMALDQGLEIDTDLRTVTYKLDESNQFQAVDHAKIKRLHWLRLQPGNNTLQFTDVNTQAVTVALSYNARNY